MQTYKNKNLIEFLQTVKFLSTLQLEMFIRKAISLFGPTLQRLWQKLQQMGVMNFMKDKQLKIW